MTVTNNNHIKPLLTEQGMVPKVVLKHDSISYQAGTNSLAYVYVKIGAIPCVHVNLDGADRR